MTDTVLVLAWLVFAHLVADFVLQNDWIALNKGQGGAEGWKALGVHGFHVGLCLSPAILAFGLPGLVYLVIVVTTHVLIDRWKVQTTRRAERAAMDAARKRLASTGGSPPSGLGSAWTPWPGMLFLADQALHLTIALVGWLVVLEGVALQPAFVDVVNIIFRTWDRAMVHAVILTGVVLATLFLVNTRGAYYFVLSLVSPRELPAPAPVPGAAAALAATPVAPAASGQALETAPTEAPEAAGAEAPGAAHTEASEAGRAAVPEPQPVERRAPSVPTGAPARIGATIGALERLLIVVFILIGAEAAVGFVIAAKTLARFKQLDDRGFAEYYLLGTLASVSVAIVSALIATAALGTIP